MIAALEDLQTAGANAVIAQHTDTKRFAVVLQFDNGCVWVSEDTFDTHEEAQAALKGWVEEIGGTQSVH